MATHSSILAWRIPIDRGTWQAAVHGVEKSQHMVFWCFPGGTTGREPICQCRRHKGCRFDPWIGKISWRRAWQPTPVFLPREFYGQKSLVGYSPWDGKESDTIEQLNPAQHRLSCSMAYGILLSQGLNLCLLHWQADSLPLSHHPLLKLLNSVYRFIILSVNLDNFSNDF